MIAEGFLPFLENGRLMYKLYKRYQQMLYIRAYCGCRQCLEWREEDWL